MACDFPNRSEPTLDYLVHNLSLVCDQRTARQLVFQDEMESSVFEKMNEIIRDSPGVHLTGMKRDCAGQVDGTDDDYTVSHDLSPGLGESAVSALLGRKVQNDGARPHTVNHFLGDEDGSPLPRNQRRGNDDV